MGFTLIGELTQVEVIAVGAAIRELPRLRRSYGKGRWRKMKGVAAVGLADGETFLAEVHWYEAHGIGRYDYKIKRRLG